VPPVAVMVCEYDEPMFPFDRVVGPTTTVAAATVMLYACVPLNGAPVPVLLSVALTVKLATPAAVAVPVIAPVLALRVRPAGNALTEIEYVYGAVPPLALTLCVYETPVVGAGSVDGVTATVAEATVTEYACVPLKGEPVPVEESIALMVKLAAPPAVGVPVIAPVVEFSVRPAGRTPDETL